ncbi:hypothetical protein PInf_015526 [Phytophthora infestans]|nr:hypothetical protein PInf_015512 [Phytophthora infestans]KAI9993444.1 hypothetical protein PInf_015526 [Phytophthora infestans]
MTASPMPRRIRLKMEQKIAMCKYAKDMRAKGKLSNAQLAAWATRAFKLEKSLSRDAARNVIAGESKWAAIKPCQLERKQLVSSQIQETDARIMKVFKAMDGKMEAITGKVIKAIALRVNTYGENTTLQERHGISKKRKHGEAASVDQEAAEAGRVKLRKLTDSYARSEICNMDETSFFFRSEAKYTLTQRKVMNPSQASSDDFPRLIGAENFDVWKTRVCAALDGKHLLGYVKQPDYDGVSEDESEDSGSESLMPTMNRMPKLPRTSKSTPTL